MKITLRHLGACILAIFAAPAWAYDSTCLAQINFTDQIVMARDAGMSRDELLIRSMDMQIQNPMAWVLLESISKIVYSDSTYTAEKAAVLSGWACTLQDADTQ